MGTGATRRNVGHLEYFWGVRGEKEEGMRNRGRTTWAQMLTFRCTGACILLLGGMVAYVVYMNQRRIDVWMLAPDSNKQDTADVSGTLVI